MKLISLLLFSSISTLGFSQFNFQNFTYSNALKKAKESNKKILYIVESKNCKQCTDVLYSGLYCKEVEPIISNNFIIISCSDMPKEIIESSNNFFSIYSDFFGLICINEEGNLLKVSSGSTSSCSDTHLFFSEILNTKANDLTNFNNVKAAYLSDSNNIDALKNLINCIVNINLDPSEILIDKLTEIVPADSSKSSNFMHYVIRLCPLVDSKARTYLYKDMLQFNNDWNKLEFQERIALNKKIEIKSMQKAIKERDCNYAYSIARFTASTYTNKSNEDKQKMSYEMMINYFKLIKDTAKYLDNVAYFIKTYYMPLNIDSMRRLDSFYREHYYKDIGSNAKADIIYKDSNESKFYKKVTKRSYTSKLTTMANFLNEASWIAYLTDKNRLHLITATQWAKLSIAYQENFANVDTYARLLYKTGYKKEAIIWEQKAINLCKDTKVDFTEFEAVLTKMQNNEDKID
jgi:hypothetical protein